MRLSAVFSSRLASRKLVWGANAFIVLALVRFGLTSLSLSTLRARLPWKLVTGPAPPAMCDRCCWALTRASRWVPGATCLTQALAGQWMLNRLGYASTVVIGVQPEAKKGLHAHAWLKSGARLIVGHLEGDLSGFNQILEFGPGG